MESNRQPALNLQLLQFFARLLIFAIILGLVNSSIVRLFQNSLELVWHWTDLLLLQSHPRLIVLLPGIGGLFAGVLIYRRSPEARGEGVPIYIKTVHRHAGFFPPFVGVYKFLAALSVMGFLGSGGFVGPVVAMNGAAGAWVNRQLQRFFPRVLGLNESNLRRGAICGVAAALGALFKTPVAGGVFAVEILSPANLNYKSLFPAVLASSAGAFSYKLLYDPAPLFPGDLNFELTLNILPLLLLTAVLAGVVGLVFVRGYNRFVEFVKNLDLSPKYTPFLGGLSAGFVGLLSGRAVLGTGHRFFSTLLNGRLVFTAALFFLVGRLLTTTFTIGSGGSAGFTFPAIVMGFLTGQLVSTLSTGLAGAEHVALLVTGMAGVLACVMNIPLAAILISMELFGYHFGFPAVVGSVIGFHIGRSEIIYQYNDQDFTLE